MENKYNLNYLSEDAFKVTLKNLNKELWEFSKNLSTDQYIITVMVYLGVSNSTLRGLEQKLKEKKSEYYELKKRCEEYKLLADYLKHN